MSTIINFVSAPSPRVEALQVLHDSIPRCVEAAAKAVGTEGVQQFFAGYKDSVDLIRTAA